MQLSTLSLSLSAIYGGRAFSPLSLFAAGEQGAWYDPSDLTTLFQDSAGTTPVTAVEQPVGLMLDKRLGLALGSELVTNGDFSSSSNWTLTGAASISSGLLTLDSTSASADALQSGISGIVAGRWYRLKCTVTKTGGGGEFRIRLGGSTAFIGTATTSIDQLVVAPASGSVQLFAQLGFVGTFDNISVRELPGNHAFQSTSASRPVLSARVNLLTKTEQFDDANWTKTACTISPNATVAPDGTTTADKLIPNSGSVSPYISISAAFAVTSGASYKQSWRVNAGDYRYIGLFELSSGTGAGFVVFDLQSVTVSGAANGATVSQGAITALGGGWFDISYTYTSTGATNQSRLYVSGSGTNLTNVTGNGTNGVFIWGADTRATNDGVGIPSYQRVNTSTDYDTTGFPLYIKPNGSTQFMLTNSINFTGTNNMTVWSGARRLSNAALAVLLESSQNWNTQYPAFALFVPENGTDGKYGFGLRDTVGGFITAASNVQAAPKTEVFSGQFNMGLSTNEITTLNVNGTSQINYTNNNNSSGTLGNFPLYLFARGGSSLWFGGRFYGLIVRGAASDATQIAQTETWMNQRTKAYAA